MIAKLHGTIEEISDNSLILNVGGVGYEVHCIERECISLRSKISEEIEIYTHYYLRENAAELYGFLQKDERNMFEILIGISGIGPKGAMNILDAAPLDLLQRAIAEGDTTVLTKVSGIGSRIAQKIIIELKDKFEAWGGIPGDIRGEGDVVDALQTLGYSRAEAQRVLRELPEGAESTEAKIREALKILGRQ